MARARMIKPEYADDEKMADVSMQARYLYILLWTQSDDYGVVKGNPRWLKPRLCPFDDNVTVAQFAEWLGELEQLKRLIKFTSHGETYYYIPKFIIHQRIEKPSKTRNPEPPESVLQQCDNESATSRVVVGDQSVTTPQPVGDEVEVGIEVENKVEIKVEVEKEMGAAAPSSRRCRDEMNSETPLEIPYEAIINDLNIKSQRTPREFFSHKNKQTRQAIKARWAEGYRFEDFCEVHSKKCKEWLGTEYAKHLCPDTLYRPTKFEKYLKQINTTPISAVTQHNMRVMQEMMEKEDAVNAAV